MGFLDNLENSLKSLEREDEKDDRSHERRQNDRADALATAPWAEKLKTSSYTSSLMDKAAAAGHRIRAKVYMAWMGSTLRLEVRGRKLELRPSPDGIHAVFLDGVEVQKSHKVNLKSDPAPLIDEWMQGLTQPEPAPDLSTLAHD